MAGLGAALTGRRCPASWNNEFVFAVVAEVADAHALGACTSKVWRLECSGRHDSNCRASLEFAKSLPFIEYLNRRLDVV